MHLTAFENATRFRDAYVIAGAPRIAEIGSQIVEGQASLRQLFPQAERYVGYDFAEGAGVDVVVEDPYSLPAADASFQCVLSSSCFEHAEFFWLSFLEMVRICAPGGLIYLNAPSNGKIHRYPYDCWRFYPDSGMALQRWGRKNGYGVTLLESFTSFQKNDCWNDYVAVFCRDEGAPTLIPESRILSGFADYKNGYMLGVNGLLSGSELTEDMARREIAARVSLGALEVTW